MTLRPVALLTDFGHRDPFVGICHGVMLREDPAIRLIDIAHGIPRQDIFAGAIALADAAPFMPDDCVFFCVVDPGVGGDRRAIAAQAASGSYFVGPDNGLMHAALTAAGGAVVAVEISESPWRLEPVSSTFHGRDIFAPVAAKLACGAPLADAGSAFDETTIMALPEPKVEWSGDAVTTSVVAVDDFGNLRLAGRIGDFGRIYRGDRLEIISGDRTWQAAAAGSYSEAENGALLLIEDSTGSPTLVVNRGSAASRMGLSPGDPVRVSRR